MVELVTDQALTTVVKGQAGESAEKTNAPTRPLTDSPLHPAFGLFKEEEPDDLTA